MGILDNRSVFSRRGVPRGRALVMAALMGVVPLVGFAQADTSGRADFSRDSRVMGSSRSDPFSFSNNLDRSRSRSGRDRDDLERRRSSRNQREDRAASWRDNRRDRSDSERPDRARLQGRTNITRRRGGGESGSNLVIGGDAGRQTPLPDLQFNVRIQDEALYFTPGQVQLRPNDRFASTLHVFNHKANPIDRMDLWVTYDPAMLEPLWVDPAPVRDRLDGELAVTVWRESGHIRIRGRFAEPLDRLHQSLGVLHWRALGSAGQTRVELGGPAGQSWGLFDGAENLLAESNLGNQSRVSMRVRVRDAGEEAGGFSMNVGAPEAIEDLPVDPDRRMHLVIVSREPFVSTGAVTTADIVLINPDREPIDTLKFRVRYDPRAVKILDADRNNYVTLGLNVFDGDFHEAFPFDFHGTNRVDPEAGVISYHVGSVNGSRVYESGTVARICYRMLRRAGTAAFWFERVDPVTGRRATDVSDQGRSRLGSTPQRARQALHGTEVSVRPLDLGPVRRGTD